MIAKPKTILAGEVAGQLITQVNNLMGRVKHTLDNGTPPNPQQGVPAVSADLIKEALGESLPEVERIVNNWSALSNQG